MAAAHHISFDMDTKVPPAEPSLEMEPGNKIQTLQTEGLEENAQSQPPGYSTNSNGSPPSYASMFGKLKEAKDESSGNMDFAKKVIPIVTCGGLCNIGVTLLFWILALACLGMGTAHLDDCPKSPMIPKYLIVFGTFYTIKVMFAILKYLRYRYEEQPEDKELPTYLKAIDGIIDCFLFIWFIVGNVYIYKIHKTYQSDDPLTDDYCNRDLYLFAFWLITFQYILSLLLICVSCCVCCVFCCVALKQSKSMAS